MTEEPTERGTGWRRSLVLRFVRYRHSLDPNPDADDRRLNPFDNFGEADRCWGANCVHFGRKRD